MIMMKNEKPNYKESRDVLPRVMLSDKIKDIIVKEVLNGKLKPGDRVVENKIARELKVSQAPVRDAVRELVLLGFLKAEPYKGTTVRSFTPEELNEVYLLRGAPESLAARLAAGLLTKNDALSLRTILNDMVDAAKNNNPEEMIRLDNDFHESILQISGNKILYQLWKTIQFGYWTLITVRVLNFDLEYLANRHEELLGAIMTKDPKKAEEAMKRHIEDLAKPDITR